MRPRSPALRRSAWLRVARAVVAALVLSLLPAPATASGVRAPAYTHVDDVVLVATARAIAAPRPRPATATAASQANAVARAPSPAWVATDASLLSPRCPELLPDAPRARLYLVHCALLR